MLSWLTAQPKAFCQSEKSVIKLLFHINFPQDLINLIKSTTECISLADTWNSFQIFDIENIVFHINVFTFIVRRYGRQFFNCISMYTIHESICFSISWTLLFKTIKNTSLLKFRRMWTLFLLISLFSKVVFEKEVKM